MRLVSVVIIWFVIIGSVFIYMAQRTRNATSVPQPVPEQTTATLSKPIVFDVTTTFPVERDPFALADDGGEGGHGLVLRLGNRILVQTSEHVQAGVPFATQSLFDLKQGHYEAYLEASPSGGGFQEHHAVRLRAFEGGRLVSEKTFWANPGEQIFGTLDVELHNAEKKDDHEH